MIPKVLNLLIQECKEKLNTKVSVNAVKSCISTLMEKLLQNEYGINKHRVSKFDSKTMEIKDSNTWYLLPTTNSESEKKYKCDLILKGVLKYWNRIKNALTTTINFLQLFGNYNTMNISITKKIKKQPRDN